MESFDILICHNFSIKNSLTFGMGMLMCLFGVCNLDRQNYLGSDCFWHVTVEAIFLISLNWTAD